MVTVGDIVRIIETVADPGLAEDWDNCGLQVGRMDHPVQKIVTALDPLPEVVQYACSVKADLLITHHPLIFRPLKRVDFSVYPGNVISMAVAHSLAIYSAHTSLDSARGGLNDMLAKKLGLKRTGVLGNPGDDMFVKLVVFTPLDHRERILEALSETTAGVIDDYTCCSFSGPGEGRFIPGKNSTPYSGHKGEPGRSEEYRIETLVKRRDVSRVVAHVRKVHPYETMAFDVYPLVSVENSEGIGRVGYLEKPMGMDDFIGHVKSCLGVDKVKTAGKKAGKVQCVALCTGSGSSLMPHFLASPADVYVSGDLSYHDARNVEEGGKTLVDVGHFASEIIMAGMLCEKIERICQERGISVVIEACTLEKDPFDFI